MRLGNHRAFPDCLLFQLNPHPVALVSSGKIGNFQTNRHFVGSSLRRYGGPDDYSGRIARQKNRRKAIEDDGTVKLSRLFVIVIRGPLQGIVGIAKLERVVVAVDYPGRSCQRVTRMKFKKPFVRSDF